MTATVHELLKLRKALEEDGHDGCTLLDLLEQAASMQVTPQLLHQTLLGRTVATLKKSEHLEVSKRAKEVVLAWKSMVITEKTSSQPLPSSAAMIQSAPSRSQSCPKIAAPSSAPQRSVSAPQPAQKHKTPPSPISIVLPSVPPPSPSPSVPPPSPSAKTPSATPQSPAGGSSTASRLSEALYSSVTEIESTGVYKMNSTNSKVRDKIQELFFGVFADANELVKTELAVRIEASLFNKHKSCSTEYRDHSREILSNLRDPKNPALKFHLLTGAWTCEELVSKSVYELAAEDLKKEREENAVWMDGWRRADWQQANRPKGGCDLFKCAKCGARDTTYTQKQTRSADEPMTTFVLCNNCGKRWKMF